MSKEKELTQLKKGTATFNLVGKANISDFTFKIDVESSKEDSDWIYNQMNLGINCGQYGTIYCDLMGGYGSSRDNVVYVHGKKDDGKDDFKSNFQIDWEDRFDEEVLKSVGDMCFINVGIEKDENGKTINKKFVHQYDAIKYINDNLTNDTIVNVKGNLEWSIYKDEIQVKKTLTSIYLSKAEEKDFKATFTQTVLLDSDSIGKLDKETNSVPITAYIIENIRKNFNGVSLIRNVNGKTITSMNLPLTKTFDFLIGEDKEKAKKMLKVFKTKGKKITQLTIDGYFTRGEINSVEVTEDDIPDDIKELIELGYVDKDEILGQIALKNGGKKPEKMIIKSPHIKYVGEDIKIPSVDKVVDLYEEDDVNLSLILESIKSDNDIENIIEDSEEESTSEEDIEKALNNDVIDDEDNDWLKDL